MTGVDFGTTEIAASASGFAPDTRDVTVSVSLSFSPDSLTLNQGATGTLTLSTSVPAPAGGFTLDLSSDDSSVASVPATAGIPAGQASAQVTVTAEAEGNTTIRASGAEIDEVTASVTVNPPQFVLIDGSATPATIRLGENLQDLRFVRLQSAPPTPVTVTLSVPADSGLLLNTTANGAGSPSISFAGVDDTGNRSFYVQGLSQGASTTLTASAPGYADATVTLAVDPSGFVISTPSGDFTTDAFAANTLMRVNPVRLNAGTLTFAGFQGIRGGFSVQVPVASSAPGVGVITTSPLTFADGAAINSVSTGFDPLAAGTTTLAVTQPAGFETPDPTGARNAGIEAIVEQSTVLINGSQNPAPIRVGENLQEFRIVRLESAPPTPGAITLSVPAGSGVLLNTAANGAGSPSISFAGVDDAGNRTFYVHGLTQGASTTLTASAPGYADATMTVAVDPSGFVISTPSGDFTTDASAGNTTLRINPIRLEAGTLAFEEFQSVRGGFSVQVPVTSSNPGVGVITTSPLTFADGATINSVSTEFDPLAAATSTISVTQPAGFDAIALDASGRNTRITATVDP